MALKEVRFKDGSRLPNGDIIAIAAALEVIAGDDGTLLPEQVVEAARTANSPLHSLFTWNDKTAAHQHRLNQARNLCRSVEIRVLTTDNEERWIRKYHSVTISKTTPPLSAYMELTTVKKNPVYVEQVARRIEEDLMRARRLFDTYAHIPGFHQRFNEVFAAIDRLNEEQAAD